LANSKDMLNQFLQSGFNGSIDPWEYEMRKMQRLAMGATESKQQNTQAPPPTPIPEPLHLNKKLLLTRKA
jgi:hypothetical protein